MDKLRIEKDSFGGIGVPEIRLWGAQTQRSLEHFAISTETMATPLLMALASVKRAAAQVNRDFGLLESDKAEAIRRAAQEVIDGRHHEEFPLSVWQTGSGTQSNMNMNEVLANRASELLGGARGEGRLIHPNDDVNRGQSSNDVFPTAMHVAAALEIRNALLPALGRLRDTLAEKSRAFGSLLKIGRTHLQDATPLSLGQEFSGYVAQLDFCISQLETTLPGLYVLAIGGTAVGTGLNAPKGFGEAVAAQLAGELGPPFESAANKFAALAGHEPMVVAHGVLKTLATALHKIANDIRWLASGPRCGLGEISIPENEPGSSIMPGKVNPVIPEVVIQVGDQVIGNDVAITLGGAQGQFELNVRVPLIARNLLDSIKLLASASRLLDTKCVSGIEPNEEMLRKHAESTLQVATALNPHIGYDAATEIVKEAASSNRTVREVAKEKGVSDEVLNEALDFVGMARPHG